MYILDGIDHNIVNDFINNLPFGKSNLIKNLYQYALDNKIPIIKDDVASFIRNILLAKKPEKILEIGTAIGYSSVFMAETLCGNCIIDTVEKNETMYDIARKNIEISGYKINIVHGDALDEISKLDNTYDFVFIDAAKGHYKDFFELIIPKLNKDAIIIGDNILYKGLVCIPINEVSKRQRTIVRNMNSFIEYIYSNDKIRTSILPIGDGLMVSNIIGNL